jgi:hypothetical protein
MRAILILFATVAAALASNVLIYDPVSAPIPGMARAYLISVNTPDYTGATNALVVPTLPVGPLQWMKVTNGAVVLLGATESNAVVSARAAAVLVEQQSTELLAKTSATNRFENFLEDGRIYRAIAEVMVDELNSIRTNMVPALAPRTLTQARNAIRAKISTQPNTAP